MAREISNIAVVDIAAQAREIWGDRADYIAGRKLPETEWRFEVTVVNGGTATMHFGATAEDIVNYAEYLSKL